MSPDLCWRPEDSDPDYTLDSDEPVKGQDREATISILDPLFQYMLKWHPEAIITGGRT